MQVALGPKIALLPVTSHPLSLGIGRIFFVRSKDLHRSLFDEKYFVIKAFE